MLLSTSDFIKIVIPAIVFLVFGIVFLAIASIFLYLIKSFFQKRGRVLGGVIFNGTEECAVVIVNDNVNSIENVVNTLKLLGISEKMAVDMMFRIHEEGIAVVWAGSRNEAIQYARQIRQNGLQCFIANIQE